MSASNPSGTSSTGTTPSENLSYRGGSRRRGPIMTAAGVGVVIVVAIIAVVAGWVIGYYVAPPSSSNNGPSTVAITESGSSLIYPLMNDYWGPNFTKVGSTTIAVSPASTGSGTGQALAETNQIDIGASDAYLANASATNLLNVPVSISSQLLYYNIPGVSAHLNINGTVLAMIYNGNILYWDDPLIVAANPGVALPHNQIIPIARADGSGDTFLITSYMYMSWAGWSAHSYGTAKLGGTLNPSIVFETGNGGMVTGAKTAYAIAYIGASYQVQAAAAGLVAAKMGDQNANSAAGGKLVTNYIAWSSTNVSQDANLGLGRLNFAQYGLAVSLILGGSPAGPTTLLSGGGGTAPTSTYPTPYPDVNLEYSLIKESGSRLGNSHQFYVVQFLTWAITIGNLPTYLSPLGFLPLTPNVLALSYQTLQTVQVS